MLEDRGNWIGIALLILCGLSAGTMLGYIDAREMARFSGPGWLGWAIVAVFIALSIFGVVQAIRGKTLGNDVRGKRRSWWRRSDGNEPR
jgi:hypothetical protein